MTAGNDPNSEPPIFSAVLTPHRSLGPRGFLIFMSVLGGVSFIAGMVFLLAGAWPVFGNTPVALMVGAIAVSTWVQAGEELGWRGYALPRLAAGLGLGRV